MAISYNIKAFNLALTDAAAAASKAAKEEPSEARKLNRGRVVKEKRRPVVGIFRVVIKEPTSQGKKLRNC